MHRARAQHKKITTELITRQSGVLLKMRKSVKNEKNKTLKKWRININEKNKNRLNVECK
jgi:hypothetical protein